MNHMPFKKLKQIVPEKLCSKCEVCCRFVEKKSVFAPRLLEADLKILFEAGLSPDITEGFRFRLKEEGSLYFCPCFKKEDNICKFYNQRPLECRLYPFLVARKDNKIFLAVDSKCPWVSEKIIEKNADYILSLKKFLQSPDLMQMMLENKSFLGDYSHDPTVQYLEELKKSNAGN